MVSIPRLQINNLVSAGPQATASSLGTEAFKIQTSGEGNNVTLDGPLTHTSGIGNNVSHDGPLAKTSGSGNNVSKDGPSEKTSGIGNNVSKDGPLTKTNGTGNNISHDGPKVSETSLDEDLSIWKKQAEKYGKVLSNQVSGKVAWTAAILNFISAPLRLLPHNPLAKIINNISLKLTQLHQLVFGIGGLLMSLRKNNPLHTVSFAWEAISACFGLREIYLFKAIASNTDILPFCVEHITPPTFKSYSEGTNKTLAALGQMIKEIKDNPGILLQKKALDKHVPIVGVALSTLGVLLGLKNDIVGGLIRNIGGIGNDFGLLFKDKKNEKTSGQWYVSGSIFDMGARLAQVFGDACGFNKQAVSRTRDFLHELALGADKIGQRYFLSAVDSVDNDLKVLHQQKQVAKLPEFQPALAA